ncbi:MAG: PAS domain S-box protein [Woeseiaceae bacterium]|nr:PAS domain S-box protein [Woeseiaceae bacterium]
MSKSLNDNVGWADAGRLKTVLDTVVDGIILIDSSGSIQMFNPACEKLFGYTAADVLGKNVHMLMPSPYREEHDRYIDNYQRTGQAKIIGIGREVAGQRKDGSTFPMDLSVGEAIQDGESTFVGIIHDLTERNRMQEQLTQAQKMETVGQLSGGIAHDFNNLLTVIIGNAEILAGSLKARPDLKELADMIGFAGSRGADLTQRLLAFSRRQTLQPVGIDCNHFIDSMQVILRRTLREDINVRTLLDSDLWQVFADPAQLESSILNLALNAQDAMPAGGSLTISSANVPLDQHYRDMHPEVPPGHYVMLAVTDNGQGMTREVLEKVFEPFFTTKDVGKGSGLGLSMVYGFVKQSNGHVTIYSEPALGTTVRMYLPASAGAAEEAVVDEASYNDVFPSGHGNVLVVEDDPFVRAYAVASVESLGYSTIAAIDGHNALAHLNGDAEIDILFSDVVMPGGVNGLELASQAIELRPRIKVLLTSGYGLESLADRGQLAPGTVVLHKPYRRADLERSLRELEQDA